jgi:hypothetical protein
MRRMGSRSVGAFALLSMLSCTGPDDLSLLDPEATDWEERRRRLDVLVETEVEGTFGEPATITPRSFSMLVAEHCQILTATTFSPLFDETGDADRMS